MTKCGICEINDSEYDLYSREISFRYTNEIKSKVEKPIISEIIDQDRFKKWSSENRDTENFDRVRICPFVICQNCFQTKFGFTEMYGFGPQKVDKPIIDGENILGNLDIRMKNLRLSENNNNWNDISKLPVIIEAKLSHDIVIGTNIQYDILNIILEISKKISLYGIEGRRVGTAFIIGGDTKRTLDEFTKQIVLNPFGSERRNIVNNDVFLKDSIIAFSQLDGIFIISGEGLVEAAGRRIKYSKELNEDENINTPLHGKGTRHHSVKMLTSVTSAIGILVSQSGPITIFKKGKKCGELKNINDYISPE